MPQVIVTDGAAEGLERCRRFLAAKAPEAARRAGEAIEWQFLLLEKTPNIGRPFPELPELRERLCRKLFSNLQNVEKYSWAFSLSSSKAVFLS